MAKTIRFNTGRKYTADGQIIIATLHDDGVATFHDTSRMITGEFAYGTAYLDHFDAREFEREVMHRYDHYEAPQTSRSWNDGMMSGACNTHGGFVAYQLAQAAPVPLMATPAQQPQAQAEPAAPAPLVAPARLNGYGVNKSQVHKNCVTVAVYRPDEPELPFVVATWWPELGNSWSWGHYVSRADMLTTFRNVAARNANR